MDRFRILFFLDSPGEGGAQRVAINILKYISRKRFEPELAVFKSEGGYKTMVTKDIKYHNLNVKRARFSILPLTHLIKKIRPALIFSTLLKVDKAVNIALKLSHIQCKLILRSSSFLSKKLNEEPFRTSFLVKWSYNCSDRIIATTIEMQNDMNNKFKLPLDKITVIPNPVDIETIEKLSREPVDVALFDETSDKNNPIIISMGRLQKVKGFSYLIKAFREVKNEIPAKLVILGNGEMKNELEKLALELDISDNVIFPGFQLNPYRFIARSNLFVLSSLYEGFPNSLLEAMACGIPVVSTNCSSGPKEIINNGESGLLVPPKDVQAMANSILQVLTNRKLSLNLTESGLKRVKDFAVKRIIKKYEQLFLSILEE